MENGVRADMNWSALVMFTWLEFNAHETVSTQKIESKRIPDGDSSETCLVEAGKDAVNVIWIDTVVWGASRASSSATVMETLD
jgi:hypothetical protein